MVFSESETQTNELYYLKSMGDVLVESYNEEQVDHACNMAEEKLYEEGATFDSIKDYKVLLKSTKVLKKEMKIAVSKNDYDGAIKIIKKIDVLIDRTIKMIKMPVEFKGAYFGSLGAFLLVSIYEIVMTILLCIPGLILPIIPISYIGYRKILDIGSFISRMVSAYKEGSSIPFIQPENYNAVMNQILIKLELMKLENKKIIANLQEAKKEKKEETFEDELKTLNLESCSYEEESVMGTVAPLLPQVGLQGSKTTDEVITKEDLKEYTQLSEDKVDGYEATFTESALIDSLKTKLQNAIDKSVSENVVKAIKLYCDKESNKITCSGWEYKLSKDDNKENKRKVLRLKKNQIKLDKDFEKAYKKLSNEEIKDFNYMKKKFDSSVKKYSKGIIKEIGTRNQVVSEAANIDEDIQDVIDRLNEKGYTTKYSSAGHENLTKKEDPDKDGVYYGKLYTDARIMFKNDYNLPDPPKYWVKKIVEGSTYLDVPPISYNEKDGSPDKAFDKWKSAYMESIRKWIADLPTAKTTKENPLSVIDKDVKESAADLFKEYYEDYMIDQIFSE